MIINGHDSLIGQEFNLKNDIKPQQNPSISAKRVHDATRTPFENLLKAFKHISLTIIKAPIALFRSAILPMRCKKSGPFLEKWSWKSIQTHCHKVKVLLKPKKPVEAPPALSTTQVIKPDVMTQPEMTKPEMTKLDMTNLEVTNLEVEHEQPIINPVPIEKLENPVKLPIKKKDKDPDLRLERKAAKALEASLAMGSDCMESTGKGVNGSQFVKSLKNKKIGVFKSIPESTGFWNPFSQKAYLNPEPGASAASERASYLLARELNTPYLTVPPVKIMDLNGKKGSFAVFEKGVPADKIIHEIDNKSSYSEEELNIFQFFIILDYLLGNLDRHLDNYLFGWDDVLKLFKAIYPIDNERSFPNEKPNWYNFNAAKNVYKWQELKLAGFKFTQTVRDIVENRITNDFIQHFIEIINSDPQIQSCFPKGDQFFRKKSQQYFELRAMRLRQIMQNPKLTAKHLAQN